MFSILSLVILKIIGTHTYDTRSEINAVFKRFATCYMWLLLVFKNFKSHFLSVRKLRKVTISIVMYVCPSFSSSVRPSVRMEQLCSHWTNFHEICYVNIFRNSL
jgi:hypothetical protein